MPRRTLGNTTRQSQNEPPIHNIVRREVEGPGMEGSMNEICFLWPGWRITGVKALRDSEKEYLACKNSRKGGGREMRRT